MTNSKIDKCIITDLPITDLDYFQKMSMVYRIIDLAATIYLDENASNWSEAPFFTGNKHILAGILINNPIHSTIEDPIKLQNLEDWLTTYNYPKSPQEKLDNILQYLFENQKHEGDYIDLATLYSEPNFYYRFYFKSSNECVYYFKALETMGLIDGRIKYGISDSNSISEVNLTFKGLEYCLNLNRDRELSNNCFIAMSFSDKTKEIRSAIKEACIITGFNPILVDEVHFPSVQTINDAIILNLKKSKFCIADFTEQKDGVYFESGFALGQGKEVIYTCRENWFKKSHFDTNHFPHITYKDENELKEKLINKIEAWIK